MSAAQLTVNPLFPGEPSSPNLNASSSGNNSQLASGEPIRLQPVAQTAQPVRFVAQPFQVEAAPNSHQPSPYYVGQVATPVHQYPIPNNYPAPVPMALPAGAVPAPVVGSWASTLGSCTQDQETCWWGCWFCWILNARTLQTFGLGSSIASVSIFCGFILVLILLFFLTGWLSCLVVGAVGGLILAYNRASNRSKIRAQYGIPGEFCGDFMVTCMCSCCAACQEGREAKARGLPRLDYCFGEDLEIPGQAAVEAADGGCVPHWRALSKTSTLALGLFAVVAVGCGIYLIATGQAGQILTIFLAFLQPLLILYFVYWRPRRQHASLDYVIKMFAVGFWFTVFQSICIETALEFILVLIFTGLFGVDLTKAGRRLSVSSIDNTGFDIRSKIRTNIIQALSHMTGYNQVDEAAMFWRDPAATGALLFDSSDIAASTGSSNAQTNWRFVVLVVYCLLMAFLVAAAVEETMKNFAVRCCRFPAELRNPHSILIYLMAAACGFATSENIMYALSAPSLAAELVLLSIRLILPVHIICSVLQAASLSKVAMGIQDLGTVRILLPAIALHGAYDFVLFLSGAIGAYYSQSADPAALLGSTIAFVIVLVVGGIAWAYRGMGQVFSAAESRYATLSVDASGTVRA